MQNTITVKNCSRFPKIVLLFFLSVFDYFDVFLEGWVKDWFLFCSITRRRWRWRKGRKWNFVRNYRSPSLWQTNHRYYNFNEWMFVCVCVYGTFDHSWPFCQSKTKMMMMMMITCFSLLGLEFLDFDFNHLKY